MNERIQELISAYLHRGSTPEQERELFEACSRNPETAELLRQHLVLSLKLHQLRDETEVPTELHNSLLRRINALEAEGVREEERRIPAAAAAPEVRRRFGWAHLLGTGLAGAAIALLFLLPGSPDGELAMQPATALRDTVTLVRTDTLLQIREVERPVYIVRDTEPRVQPEAPRPGDAGELAQQPAPGREVLPEVRRRTTEQPDQPADTDRVFAVTEPDTAEQAPLFADNMRPESGTREAKAQNYLEQYNSMLVSVESVRLSSKDRLH